MSDDLAVLDAVGQAELVRRREVTPGELVDAAITRIEKLNPEVNAVIHPLFDTARRQATGDLTDGPFRGVPIVLKDFLCHSAGDPYHEGMRFLRDIGWTEAADCHAAAKLRAAGCVFVGRTNVPELAYLATTEPESYGPTRNPWDPGRAVGGSSGGSAAAVASGMVPVAEANDAMGSLRIPASLCGLVGLKVSRGRISLGPSRGESLGLLAVEGVLSRSVRDTAAMLDVLAGGMPGDPIVAPPPGRPYREEVGIDLGRLSVGLCVESSAWPVLHADCLAAVIDAARLLEDLGHIVEPADPPGLDYPDRLLDVRIRGATSTAAAISRWEARTGRTIGPADVEPLTWMLAEEGRSYTATQLAESLERIQANARELAGWWAQGYDLLLTPTTADVAPPLGEFRSPDNPLQGVLRTAPFTAYTYPVNRTGQPAISLPLYWSESGLPVGSQLVAAYGREDLLLSVAAQLEEARPWVGRRPPLGG